MSADSAVRRSHLEVSLSEALAAIRGKAAVTTNPSYGRALRLWLAIYDWAVSA